MSNMRNVMAALIIVSASMFAACSGNKQEAKAGTGNAEAARPVEVSTATVIERNAPRAIEVVGSFEADDEVTLSSQAAGTLVDIEVDVGTPVRKGQAIGRIDARELKLKVEQAEANLRQAEARLGIKDGGRIDPEKQPDVRQAKAALERARYDWRAAESLVEQGDVSRQQYDVAQKAFEQAEARYQAALENVRNLEAVIEEKRAALALSKKQLSDTTVISPLSGVVKQKIASRGEYLKAGDPIAIIVRINPLRLKLEVPESFAANINRGQAVTLKVDSFPDREFQGKIKRINPSLNEQNRSLEALAEVANSNGMLRPGMFARASVVSDATDGLLMVPEKALVSLAGVNKVFVVEGDRAIERQVKIGARDGSMVEIVEGVRSGERVITSNTDKLHDGASVKEAGEQGSGGAAGAGVRRSTTDYADSTVVSPQPSAVRASIQPQIT
ncbi:MAG: efflux RND transporter periplasmic adaptor subunit, partial [Blastocatellia bacterium]|nr:efflux RND transporter periplasmic adaptor subunit [Blastocatellia bacterium]